MQAEIVYLFRHAVLRDAAYELQLPGERATLHELALRIIESAFPSAELRPLAAELADHARLAITDDLADDHRRDLLAAEHRYLNQAADYLQEHWQATDAVRVRDLLADHPCADGAARRQHLHVASNLLLQGGDLRGAESRARDMLERSTHEADHGDETRALLLLHSILPEMGRANELTCTTEELVSRTAGLDVESRLLALKLLEGEKFGAGRFAEAQEMVADMLELARESAKAEWVASLTSDLAILCQRLGNHERALEYGREGVKIAAATGNKKAQAESLNLLGIVCVESGDIESARDAYEQALTVARAIGVHSLVQILLVNLGNLHLYFLGNLRAAEHAYREVLDFALEQGSMNDAANVSSRLGALLVYRGTHEAALEVLHSGVEYARLSGLLPVRAALHMQISRCRKVLGPAQRVEELVKAVGLARKARAARAEGEAWMRIADLLVEQGALKACLEVADAADRVLEAAPGGAAYMPHVDASRALAYLLLGENGAAGAAVQRVLQGLGPNVPHHRVSSGYAISIALRTYEGVGAIGLDKPDESVRADVTRMYEEASAMLRDTEYRHFGRVRDALDYAADAARLLTSEPPLPLLLGYTLKFLMPQQVRAVLDRLASEEPVLLERLKRENPQLAAEANEYARPTLVAWDAPLEQLPALAALLEEATP